MADLWYASEQCQGVTQRTKAVSEPIYASWMPPPSLQRADYLCQNIMSILDVAFFIGHPKIKVKVKFDFKVSRPELRLKKWSLILNLRI